MGLELCPAEVGPGLRLAYENQPLGERLIIATKPFTNSGNDLDLFVMEVSGGGGCGSAATAGLPTAFGSPTVASCSCGARLARRPFEQSRAAAAARV